MLKVKKVYQMQDGVLKEFEEVRHGKWVQPDMDSRFYDFYECSLCGYSGEWRVLSFHYCPRCGAKMREDKKDEKESVYDKLPPEVQKHVDEAVDYLLGKDEEP